MPIEHLGITIFEGSGFYHYFFEGRVHISYTLDHAKSHIKWLKHSETFHNTMMDIIDDVSE